ncbi:winged helix-turn-helix transcriptional regulator [Amycolatopsis taiwanensis]|uniref:Transcriptional regulator n=1 Tax=Amycolatopsis taiwanensis TaxID=342230 RepID=A0A9W6VJJ0_9PSEU|nr:winged helix-turn-helix transcriptional regulator [Amycolatopsis taiwanensis]GLY68556.1 transcriptional regulator [Amycolatopsis taiwanensis]
MSRRTYNQYCATARTLDIVGERWTLLVIRELLTGPKRFGDLLANLAGMGTGLLAARLRYLQEEGLVQQVVLPPPAKAPAYALTEAGADLGPTVLALARWGLRWAAEERREGEVFRLGWTVLGMQAIFDAEAARDVRAVYEFRVDDDVFHVRVEHGEIESVHGPAQRPDVVIETSAEVFRALMAGELSVAEAKRSGSAEVSGDQQLLRKLRSLFRLPQPQARVAEEAAGGSALTPPTGGKPSNPL